MRCKSVTALRHGLPPWCPDIVQACPANQRRFISQKKCRKDFLSRKHLCNQRRDTHMPRIKRQIYRLGTLRLCCERRSRQYEFGSLRADRILREGSVCQCGKTNYAEKPTDDSHDPVTTRRVEIYPR